MPLLITPSESFTTSTGAPLASAYAIILKVEYDTRVKRITYRVGYFYSEAAYVAQAEAVQCTSLPTTFEQDATPEQANAAPIFQFLEQVLTAQLTQLLGEGTTIDNVA